MDQKKIIIDEQGEKKLDKNEEAREHEIKKMEKAYQDAKNKLIDDAAGGPGKLDKLRFWKDKQVGDVTNPKYWALVNVESMKEFVKYGANKVLDQIRVRTAANIAAREEIARAKAENKSGWDGKNIAMTFIMLAVAACIAWIMISNFFDYRAVADDNIKILKEKGTVVGDLAACRAELFHYNPAAIPPDRSGDQPDNVLEG